MGYGNWIEERRFEFPADVVYETLLGVLSRSGLSIESSDAGLRGVVASRAPSWRGLFTPYPEGHARIAASLQPFGDRASTITIESGPAYARHLSIIPWWSSERWHKKHIERILTALSQALGEPKK